MSQSINYAGAARVGVGVMSADAAQSVTIPAPIENTMLVLAAGNKGTRIERVRLTRVCDSAGSLQVVRFYLAVGLVLTFYRDVAFAINPGVTTFGTQVRPAFEFATPGLVLVRGQQLRFTRNTNWPGGTDVYTAIALGFDL